MGCRPCDLCGSCGRHVILCEHCLSSFDRSAPRAPRTTMTLMHDGGDGDCVSGHEGGDYRVNVSHSTSPHIHQRISPSTVGRLWWSHDHLRSSHDRLRWSHDRLRSSHYHLRWSHDFLRWSNNRTQVLGLQADLPSHHSSSSTCRDCVAGSDDADSLSFLPPAALWESDDL